MRTAINPNTGEVFLVDFTDKGESDVPASEALDALASQVSHIENDYISKTQTSTQELQSPIEITKQIDVVTDDGESLQIGINENSQAYVGSNVPLNFMNDVGFTKNPTCPSNEDFDNVHNIALVTKNQINQRLEPLENDINDMMGDISKLEADLQQKSNGSSRYGIQADYALQYGVTDCPNGIITTSINNKEITVQPGVKMWLAGNDMATYIASPIKYTIEETGTVTLFFTKVISSSGTIQTGILEAGDVYYQENEPSNGTTSYLAWWNPNVGKWQFKSDDTGNVWREAIATPFVKIKTNSTGVVSSDYRGFRLMDDDILAQLSDIENIQDSIQEILLRLENLESR